MGLMIASYDDGDFCTTLIMGLMIASYDDGDFCTTLIED